MVLSNAQQAATLSAVVWPKSGQCGSMPRSVRSSVNCQAAVDCGSLSMRTGKVVDVGHFLRCVACGAWPNGWRFYIPEGAGRVKWLVCPFLGAFPAGFGHAGRRAGVKVERPAGRTTLRPVLLPVHAEKAGNGYVGCGVRAPFAVVSVAGARLRSSLRGCPRLVAAGAWGGFACGQRDQSDQAAARRWRGPVKPAITRCPRPCVLMRPCGRWRWPGRGPGRRASRRRPTSATGAPSRSWRCS
jgi:hypothetical protein